MVHGIMVFKNCVHVHACVAKVWLPPPTNLALLKLLLPPQVVLVELLLAMKVVLVKLLLPAEILLLLSVQLLHIAI